jgi:hypothetical protein
MLHHMLRAAAQRAFQTLDPYFKYVTMLLHGDGTNGAQNNTFLDSSTNNFTITRNGNTTQGTFSPYGSNWSNYFNGSSYETVAGSTNLAFGTGDFTIECWVNFNSVSSGNLLDMRPSSTNGAYPNLYVSSGTLAYYVSSSDRITGGTVTVGTWYHIALCRSGTSTKLFLNGTQIGSTYTDSNNYVCGTNRPMIAGNGFSNSANFNAYVSNFRFIKGTALYTTSFTPPTTPLTAITNTSLLICQSNRFIDNSASPYTITISGSPSVQRFSPFSPTSAYSTSVIGGSGYFDGSGDYLSLPNNSALSPQGGDFCIEAWIYPLALPSQYAHIYASNSTAGVVTYINSNGTVSIGYSGNFEIAVSATAIPLNAWTHVAFTRSGTTVRIFLNGVQSASATNSTTFSSTVVGTIAFVTGFNSLNGYMSDVRFVKGSAVYTSAFTPPSAPLTAITNTSLLTNFTNAGILDNAMMNDLETVGNAQISTSVKKFGTGSMYFDGTGDYLRTVTTPLASLQGDFTIECWLYWTAHGNYGGIVSCANSNIGAAPTSGWAFVFYSTTNRLYFETGTGFSLQTTNTIPSSQWNHVAVVRSGSTITHYLNGVANGSGTSSAAFNVLSTDNFVIGVDRGLANTLTGYIDDLRITKGVARYTSNFTAPTAAFPNN